MASRSLIAATCLLLATTACGSAPEPEKSKSSPDGAATTLRLNPGRWQQAGAVATAAGPAESRCVSAQEALSANGSDDQIKAALQAQADKDKCTIKSVDISAQTIAWTQTCSGADLTMTTDYRGDSLTTTITGGGMPPLKTESVRVGDC